MKIDRTAFGISVEFEAGDCPDFNDIKDMAVEMEKSRVVDVMLKRFTDECIGTAVSNGLLDPDIGINCEGMVIAKNGNKEILNIIIFDNEFIKSWNEFDKVILSEIFKREAIIKLLNKETTCEEVKSHMDNLINMWDIIHKPEDECGELNTLEDTLNTIESDKNSEDNVQAFVFNNLSNAFCLCEALEDFGLTLYKYKDKYVVFVKSNSTKVSIIASEFCAESLNICKEMVFEHGEIIVNKR